jgi:cysteine desulfurase
VVLDAGGRAPVLPAAREAFLAALDEGWADPRRLHTEGRRARALLDGAREAVAGLVGARSEEVDLAPSLTAALHGAVLTVARGRRRVGATVVASAVERMAVLDAADLVATSPAPTGDGGRVTVPVDRDGRVDLAAFAEAVAGPGVALAAVQHANGEIGTLQPLAAAHAAARAARVPLLVDAGSSFGHVPVGADWDVLTLDPGDVGAVPGVAVLVTRAGVRRSPVGPPDEDRWFPGGVSVPAALAAAVALQAADARARAGTDPRTALVDRVRARVAAEVPAVDVAGPGTGRLPHVLTFSCLYVDGEAVVTALDRAGFAVASGSACTSATEQPSHVLTATGSLTQGNVRLSLPVGTTVVDVERFCDVLPGVVAGIRRDAGLPGL